MASSPMPPRDQRRDPDDGGIAAEAADYNHLLLLGPADPGYFSTPSQMPGG